MLFNLPLPTSMRNHASPASFCINNDAVDEHDT